MRPSLYLPYGFLTYPPLHCSHSSAASPLSIQVAGTSTLLEWQYTTDPVGNITLIDNLQSAQDRVFAYRDFQYFLTQGNGPWGTRSWSYDKIGNRLSETRNGVTDTYTYLLNGVSGRTPKLSQISLGGGGTKTFGYDAIGDQTSVDTASDAVDLLYDAAKRLTTIERNSGAARSDFLYDGRSFLRRATPSAPLTLFVDGFESGSVACWSTRVGAPAGGTCPAKPKSEPTYSSEGTLMHVRRAGGVEDEYVFYFAGRPVGILTRTGSASSLKFLSADHLGTPILATSGSGSALWSGGFEPFGADWNNAQGVGMLLRFPGQWDDAAWSEGSVGTDVYYNVHRWYGYRFSRYSKADPLGLYDGPNLYGYLASNPINGSDPLGLAILICSRKSFLPFRVGNHAYFWDDRYGPLFFPRSCARGRFSSQEKGPLVDECKEIPGSEGKEDLLMACCQSVREVEPFIPFFNDCQSALASCVEALMLPETEAPGGRFGPPCDRSPTAKHPRPPLPLYKVQE